MVLNELKLINFKNYHEAHFRFNRRVVSISGDNGMGKTNVLDAIYFLALGKSYLTSTDKNLVTTDRDFFRMEASLDDNGKNNRLVVKYRLGGGKEIELNDVKLSRLSDHIGLIPVVFISPDDVHNLLAGNEERRVFVNNTLVQFDPVYLDALAVYNRNLKQRNALLKDFADRQYWDQDLLDIITRAMAPHSHYIHKVRQELTHSFSPVLQRYYDTISDGKEKVALVYSSQLDEGDFFSLSQSQMQKEKFTQRTAVGIHKDEFSFFMDGKPIRDYASQGQLKSYIFGLKLAQYAYLKDHTGKSPLLLLDDVFDKLDQGRVARLLALITGLDFGQIFITDTHQGRAVQLLPTHMEVEEFVIRDGAILSHH